MTAYMCVFACASRGVSIRCRRSCLRVREKEEKKLADFLLFPSLLGIGPSNASYADWLLGEKSLIFIEPSEREEKDLSIGKEK